MKSIFELLKESYKKLLVEGGASGHMTHIFEDGEMTFGELKEIFRELFSGEIEISEKTDGQALAVTYKDGEVKAARNKATLKEPMSIAELEKKFDGRGEIKDAFVNSMKDISSAVKSLSKSELKRIFNDGHNYMAFEIIYPPTKNVVSYGDRCLIQLHGVNIYDDNYNKVSEDKSLAKKLYELLKKHNALNQENFEIANDAKLKIKNSKTAKESLADVISKLEKIQGKLPDDATIKDFVAYKYKAMIRKAAKESGLSDKRTSEFISKLVNRLSYVSNEKISKADLQKVAQEEGIDSKSKEYKEFINQIEATQPDDNQKFILPIEALVVDAGTQLMKNLVGYVTADRSESAKELSKELDDAIAELEKNKDNLSPSGVKALEKNLMKLEKFGKESTGVEGIVFLYKGKVYKMTGNFGAINQILGIMRYGR